MTNVPPPGNLVDVIKLSPPVDLTQPYDPAWVAGRTILITGGASGFGEGFFRKWAANGANVIIGDVNDSRGTALVNEVRKTSGNSNHHYIHCDVTNWQSQVDFFKAAAKLSVTGGIDAVVANAGIAEPRSDFEFPEGLDGEAPAKPSLKTFEVNLIGVLYTVHLALFYLPLNPRSINASPSSKPAANTPDRHILLIGSLASISPLPGQILYAVSKHGVLGLFRSLRGTMFTKGIRINLLCPYFIDTPLIPVAGRVLLAGGAMGKPEDVVDAGTRLMADTRIVGRALIIGPKVQIENDNEWGLVPQTSEDGKGVAVWEAYAHDYEVCDNLVARYLKVLRHVETVRGWAGWAYDIAAATTYPLRTLLWEGILKRKIE